MKTKNKSYIIHFLFLIYVCILTTPLSLGQVYDNIGFKKDIPEEIKKECATCDEFLDVKWVDEKRYIGKLKTEWYKDGQKQGILYLLVKLEEPGSEEMLRRGTGVFYEITEEEYNSKEFENYIRNSEVTYEKGYFLLLFKKRKSKKELIQKFIPSEFYKESYLNFSKIICLLYPKNNWVLIIETKKPFLKEEFSKELKEKYNNILKYVKEEIARIGTSGAQIEFIKYCDVIDFNFDGLDDYIFGFNVGNVSLSKRVILYFSKNRNYLFKDLTNCILGMNVYYMRLDKNQIFFGKCDLTEFVKGGN